MRPGYDDAGLAPGAENSQQADNAADIAANAVERQAKPEIDLASWASLGKSSRTERRQKRKWGRK